MERLPPSDTIWNLPQYEGTPSGDAQEQLFPLEEDAFQFSSTVPQQAQEETTGDCSELDIEALLNDSPSGSEGPTKEESSSQRTPLEHLSDESVIEMICGEMEGKMFYQYETRSSTYTCFWSNVASVATDNSERIFKIFEEVFPTDDQELYHIETDAGTFTCFQLNK